MAKKDFVLIGKNYIKQEEAKNNKVKSNKVALKDYINLGFGKLNTNQQKENGQYPFFTCGQKVLKIDKYAYDQEAILVAGNGDVGTPHYYHGKFNAYQKTYIISSKDTSKFLNKYLYYMFVKAKRERIWENQSRGAVLQFITKKMIEDFELELISIEEQKKIIETQDFIHEQLNKSKVVVVENIQKEIEIMVKSFRGQKVKLSDLVDIKGGRLESKYAKDDGQYPFFVCGAEVLKIDKADYDQEAVLLAGTGEVYAFYYNGKFNARQKVHIFTKKKDSPVDIDMKLLYYIINNNLDYFRSRQQGATMKNVDQENVMSFEFNLPEDSKKALEQLEQKTKIIELIKKDLMNNDN